MLRLGSLLLAIVVLMGFAARQAEATLIGVGLDWRSGVFAQEYWEKGNPFYLIANHSKDAVEINLHDFDSKWRLGQPLGKVVAGPWKVPNGGVAKVDAKALVGGGLRRWVVGGKTPLGVLGSPIAPGYEGPELASATGLNGSGGMVPGVFVTQPKMEAAGGGKVKLVLHIPANTGVIRFTLKPDVINDPMRPANVVPEAAESDTLKVSKDDKAIAIDTNAPLKEAASHQVTLTVPLPKGQTSRLFMLDGWLMRTGGGGNGITRGIWVTAP